MKVVAVMLLFAAVTGIAGCSKGSDPISFYIKNQADIQINSSVYIDMPFDVATPDMTTNSSQEFQNNNTHADLVKDIKLSDLKLSITSPSGKSFSFLKSVHLYISTTDNNEVELAYLDNIPADATVLTLTTTGNKLDNYVKASSYKLRTQVVTRETLMENVDMHADVKFKVTANL